MVSRCTSAADQLLRSETRMAISKCWNGPELGSSARFCLLVPHDDADRQWAYDRKSRVGQLDKAWDEAVAKGWTIVSMKDAMIAFFGAVSFHEGNGSSAPNAHCAVATKPARTNPKKGVSPAREFNDIFNCCFHQGSQVFSSLPRLLSPSSACLRLRL